jgi:hypothetical protein
MQPFSGGDPLSGSPRRRVPTCGGVARTLSGHTAPQFASLRVELPGLVLGQPLKLGNELPDLAGRRHREVLRGVELLPATYPREGGQLVTQFFDAVNAAAPCCPSRRWGQMCRRPRRARL